MTVLSFCYVHCQNTFWNESKFNGIFPINAIYTEINQYLLRDIFFYCYCCCVNAINPKTCTWKYIGLWINRKYFATN